MKKLLLSAVLFSIGFVAFAQDDQDDTHTLVVAVPEIALVDIEPAASKNLILSFDHSDEAGDPLTDPTDDTTLWLNYSSIKSTANPTRTISVNTSALLSGIDIVVTAAADAGNGDGTMGAPSAALTLTTADQTIISGIGSSYTGNGANNGHNLTYSLEFGSTTGTANYADLDANTSSATVTITYTISN